MIIIKKEQIKGHDISLIQNIAEMSLISEISFQDKIFVQKSSFPSQLKEKVITFAQNHEKYQGEFLIIDCGEYITLWVEKIKTNPIHQNTNTSNVNSVSQTSQSETSSMSEDSEKDISETATSEEQYTQKTYRGITYYEKKIEHSQETDNLKEKRKYRGNYY